MVKIAFSSLFAHKDEPKKDAAEALVTDKVRDALCGERAFSAAGERRGEPGRRHLLITSVGWGRI